MLKMMWEWATDTVAGRPYGNRKHAKSKEVDSKIW